MNWRFLSGYCARIVCLTAACIIKMETGD